MITRPLRVLYLGPGLCGRATSLASAARRSGVKGVSERTEHASFGLPWRDGHVSLTATVSTFRAWLHYSDPGDPRLHPQIKYELGLLAQADGLVFVIDARPFREEHCFEALELLQRDLQWLGRSLDAYPVVFQVNWLDASDAKEFAWYTKNFASSRCAHVASNALIGDGTLEALQELVRMCADTHPHP